MAIFYGLDIWMIAFFATYFVLCLVLYLTIVKRLVRKFMGKEMFLRYIIVDTGATGEMVFQDGINVVNGIKRIYARECVSHGMIFYESSNAEPLRMTQDIRSYRYYCDTKNFDTILRNDLLETLMVLNAKQLLMILIIVAIVVVIMAALINGYLTSSKAGDVLNAISSLQQTINQTRGR